MWRPEGWERQRAWDGQIIYGDFEAGADAMLEAQKKASLWSGYIGDTMEFKWTPPKGTMQGHIVFIPEEKALVADG